MAAGLLVIVGIPVAWWFISSSLRKASGRIIDEQSAIHIRVSNLVKIYGRESKIVREFKAGGKMAKFARSLDMALKPRLESLIWQLPLLGFLVYFSWFYLLSGFWQLVSSVVAWYYLVAIIADFSRLTGKRWLKLAAQVVRYGAPLVVLVIFHLRWDNLPLSLLAGWLMVSGHCHEERFQQGEAERF